MKKNHTKADFRDKKYLIKELISIKNKYIEAYPDNLNPNDNSVNNFANCLDKPNLNQYFFNNEIIPFQGKFKYLLPQNNSVQAIIDSFEAYYILLMDMGLIKLKTEI